MYNILQHHRELGAGPREHGLGSRARQQRPLNFKERNSFLPSNWSFRPFLARSAHTQLPTNSGEEKLSCSDQAEQRFPCVGYLWACGDLYPLSANPPSKYKALLSQASRSCRNRKGAKVGAPRGTRSMGEIFTHLTYKGIPSDRVVGFVGFTVCKLTKALG